MSKEYLWEMQKTEKINKKGRASKRMIMKRRGEIEKEREKREKRKRE